MSNHFAAVQGYSEDALYGAIASLTKNGRSRYEGTWEHGRLLALKEEANRRNRKRRGKESAA